MNNPFRTLLGLSVIIVILAAGCSAQQTEDDSVAAAQNAGTHDGAGGPDEGGGHGHEDDSSTPMEMGHGADDIWSQIEAEESKLASAIGSGQLADVHHLAFGVRDLVIAFVDKSGDHGETSELTQLVEEIRKSADRLDETGDRGDLSGTEKELERFQELLMKVQSLTGHHDEES